MIGVAAFMLAVSVINIIYVAVIAVAESWHVRAATLISGYVISVGCAIIASIWAYRRNQSERSPATPAHH